MKQTKQTVNSAPLKFICLGVMVVLSLTQLFPGLHWAGISVFVGIAGFFLGEALDKTPKECSGLRFRGLGADLKKSGVCPLVLLPVVTAILPALLGNLLFDGGYTAHIVQRAGAMVRLDQVPVLAVQVIVLALGEEIAWRGFALGIDREHFWLFAVGASALFAIGHIASGPALLVLYDISFIFLDSMIFSLLFRKTGNCLVSTLAHILGNTVGIAVCLLLA